MISRNSGQPEIVRLVPIRFSYNFIVYCVVLAVLLPICSSISSSSFASKPDSTESRPFHTSETERLGKQLSFWQWFFGPPAPIPSNSTHGHRNRTVFHNNQMNLTRTPHSNHSEPNKDQVIVTYQPPLNNSVVYYPSFNGSDADPSFPSGPIFAKPRDVSNRFNDSRQIQITDIQASVGSELNEANLNSDPSQVNLQEELDAIDRIEKNLTDGPAGFRNKRDSSHSTKFRQISIPYGHGYDGHNEGNVFSKRQLLMTPEHQQLLMLRQQQEIAAAAMLQQQLLSSRYNNRYIDDYYDDDSSYEDSDERFEDFRRFGLHNPVAAAMNRGSLFVPPVHPLALGRRSLPDEKMDRTGLRSSKKAKKTRAKKASGTKGGVDSVLGPILKTGRWETIEDYDLTSDFNRIQSRRGMPADDHRELDESVERNPKTEKVSFRNRGRIGMFRQDMTMNETHMSTEGQSPTPGSSTEPTPSATSTTEESTSESETGESSSGTGSTPENVSGTNGSEESGTEPETALTESPMTESEESGATDSSESSGPETTKPSTTTKMPNPSTTTTRKPKPSSSTTPPMLPPFQQTLNCRCGVQSVRGEMADDGTIIRTMVNPWLVSISNKQKHLCSGSIINNKYILTSKQCVKGMKGLIVTAGTGSRASRNFTVIKVNSHESRNIALLKIKPAITPNHAMRPICLPIKKKTTGESSNPPTGTLVTFKKSSSRINSPIQLVQTEVPIPSSAKCSGPTGDLPKGMICPMPPASIKCGGDTGGLLQVYQRGYSYEQIGVVSHTVGCRANKTPGAYTDIRKSVKWIMYNTKDARYCRKPKVSVEALMNTKRAEADNEPEFTADEDESNEEFTFDDGAREEVDEAWE